MERSLPAAGVDIGGTKIAAGSVDTSGRVLSTIRRPTPTSGPAAVVRAIAELVAELMADAGPHAAVGLGVAGFVSRSGDSVILAPNLHWRDVPLRELVSQAIGLEATVDNDANAAAWGEFRFGAGREATDVCCVTLGTGIGGGLISDGRLLRGGFGIAGEVGHLPYRADGRWCGCGNRGCWEQYASGRALALEAFELARNRPDAARRLLELSGGVAAAITGPMVTTAAREGDSAALLCLAELGRAVGWGLAALASVADPTVFVLGGGLAEEPDLLLDSVRASFAANLPGGNPTVHGPPPDVRVQVSQGPRSPDDIGRAAGGAAGRPIAEIRPAQLGNLAGLVGAADIARSAAMGSRAGARDAQGAAP